MFDEPDYSSSDNNAEALPLSVPCLIRQDGQYKLDCPELWSNQNNPKFILRSSLSNSTYRFQVKEGEEGELSKKSIAGGCGEKNF